MYKIYINNIKYINIAHTNNHLFLPLCLHIIAHLFCKKKKKIDRIMIDGSQEMLTASVIGNEIAVFVKIMCGIQTVLFWMDVMEVLAVEDDTAQSFASG